MKQRVITAVVLLALLAVVVWQINTPVLVLVIAFLAAVAANEIMRCARTPLSAWWLPAMRPVCRSLLLPRR